MAQRSMFFDAVNGDRSYDATSLAALLRTLVQHDGVVYGYGGNLAVSATDPASMNVTAATGAAFVQGRMFEVHTAGETLAIGAADPTNPRIDRVVVKLDNSSAVRSVSLAVKAGTPAASPIPPALQRDGTVWELSLAQVYVAAGMTSISSANITDERSDATACGYADGMVLGSNANGSYVRFANGLQMCWGIYVFAAKGVWESQALPAVFKDTAFRVFTTQTTANSTYWYNIYAQAETTSTIKMFQATNNTAVDTGAVTYFAIGLWR